MDRPGQIVPDTLSKLRAFGHGLWGWCYNCAGLFDIDVPALVREHGADCDIARLAAVCCPHCGSRAVEMQIVGLDEAGAAQPE